MRKQNSPAESGAFLVEVAVILSTILILVGLTFTTIPLQVQTQKYALAHEAMDALGKAVTGYAEDMIENRYVTVPPNTFNVPILPTSTTDLLTAPTGNPEIQKFWDGPYLPMLNKGGTQGTQSVPLSVVYSGKFEVLDPWQMPIAFAPDPTNPAKMTITMQGPPGSGCPLVRTLNLQPLIDREDQDRIVLVNDILEQVDGDFDYIDPCLWPALACPSWYQFYSNNLNVSYFPDPKLASASNSLFYSHCEVDPNFMVQCNSGMGGNGFILGVSKNAIDFVALSPP